MNGEEPCVQMSYADRMLQLARRERSRVQTVWSRRRDKVCRTMDAGTLRDLVPSMRDSCIEYEADARENKCCSEVLKPLK